MQRCRTLNPLGCHHMEIVLKVSRQLDIVITHVLVGCKRRNKKLNRILSKCKIWNVEKNEARFAVYHIVTLRIQLTRQMRWHEFI